MSMGRLSAAVFIALFMMWAAHPIPMNFVSKASCNFLNTLFVPFRKGPPKFALVLSPAAEFKWIVAEKKLSFAERFVYKV